MTDPISVSDDAAVSEQTISRDASSNQTPDRTLADVRRKRTLPSPYMRTAASPGHRAQMQKIFQEAKTSLQRDMVFASSPLGSIASRLPSSESHVSSFNAGLVAGSIDSLEPVEQGTKDWRYSTAPEDLAGIDTDVREPLPHDGMSPCLPTMPPSEFGEAASVACQGHDVNLDDLPPLPDSDPPEGTNAGSESSTGHGSCSQLVTTSYGVPLVQPMSAAELERPMEKMEVSQVDAWLHDVLDDETGYSSRRRQPGAADLKDIQNEPIYLSTPAKAAAESAKFKRGYRRQESGSDKENMPPASNLGLLARPPVRLPSPFRPFTNPPSRPQLSNFMHGTPACTGSASRIPISAFSLPGYSKLAPPPMRRVTSTGSPLPTFRGSTAPSSTVPRPQDVENSATQFRYPSNRDIARYYPAYYNANYNLYSRTPPPSQSSLEHGYPAGYPNSTRSTSDQSHPQREDHGQTHCLRNQKSAGQLRSRLPMRAPGPEFYSSPPRPANYHQLPPRRKKIRNAAALGPCREDLAYYGPAFEIAEDEETFNAMNEADIAVNERFSPIPDTSIDAMQTEGSVVEDPGSAFGNPVRGQRSPVYYDGSEDFDPSTRNVRQIRRQAAPQNQGFGAIKPSFMHGTAIPNTIAASPNATSAITDADLRELSPNVTPYRKGPRSKKRHGLRVSPGKRQRCPSYNDEDIIPPGDSDMVLDESSEVKRAALEELVTEDRVVVKAPQDPENAERVAMEELEKMEEHKMEGGA